MQQISLREANQHLSRYIDAVEQGDEIIITKRGQPVAKLLAITPSHQLSLRQKVVWKRLLTSLQKGYHLGGKKITREKLHER